MKKNRVFISKGSTATNEQRAFVDAVLDKLITVGLSPRIMNENEWSHEQPLQAISKIISECDGAVVIAFTRCRFKEGVELNGYLLFEWQTPLKINQTPIANRPLGYSIMRKLQFI